MGAIVTYESMRQVSVLYCIVLYCIVLYCIVLYWQDSNKAWITAIKEIPEQRKTDIPGLTSVEANFVGFTV